MAAVAEERRTRALAIFDDPALRRVLIDQKKLSEVVIDDISHDVVVSSLWDEGRATAVIADFDRFLHTHRDRLAALRILYAQPAAGLAAHGRLTYAALEDLRDAMLQPPWLLDPLALWSAYRRLRADKVRANPAKTLTDIVALVRFALGQRDTLAPLSSDMAGRFNLWLGREDKAGRTYTPDQRAWLEAIRDYLAANIEIAPADLQDQFAPRGGIVGARRAFGPSLDTLLETLQDALVA
ncbi:hypothetical protein NFI95_10435 [Acetobacteraceae bacterium KSS8]|uniref:EcoEI R protein C-terminal domain-containing protein n=1 Tax=Endosaccharibacter trunci TaxID=2812733 RepID=A0ABT1W7M1_9PROT|nr:hypothetical protein [Acetobacteraceae bacterium KSS8]